MMDISTLLENQFLVGAVGAMLTGGAMFMLRQSASHMAQHVRGHLFCEFSCNDRSSVYAWLTEWLAATKYGSSARRLNFQSKYDHALDQNDGQVGLAFGIHYFFHDGVFMIVERRAEGGDRDRTEWYSVRALTRRRDFILNILADAQTKFNKPSPSSFRIKMPDGEHWTVAKIRKVTPGALVLRPGVYEKVTAQVSRFLTSRVEYDALGVPWRMGCLFEGAPGTGKTSLVRDIAAAFNLDLHILNLRAALLDDNKLMRLVQRVPQKSIILIEDVDAINAGLVERPTAQGTPSAGVVTLSGLLNAMDGVTTPEGVLIILSTNRPEALDEAIVRPGRINLRLNLPCCDAEQAAQMYLKFFPARHPDAISFGQARDGVPPAQVEEELLGMIHAARLNGHAVVPGYH